MAEGSWPTEQSWSDAFAVGPGLGWEPACPLQVTPPPRARRRVPEVHALVPVVVTPGRPELPAAGGDDAER